VEKESKGGDAERMYWVGLLDLTRALKLAMDLGVTWIGSNGYACNAILDEAERTMCGVKGGKNNEGAKRRVGAEILLAWWEWMEEGWKRWRAEEKANELLDELENDLAVVTPEKKEGREGRGKKKKKKKGRSKEEKEKEERKRREEEERERKRVKREEEETALREKEERERDRYEREEKERQEWERVEKVVREQERKEREKAKKEKAKKEKADNAAKKKREKEERVESERVKKERAEKERAEKERAEKEMAEKKRAQKERVEKEMAGEKERVEKERVEKVDASYPSVSDLLESLGMSNLLGNFEEQGVDIEALMLCSNEDLKELEINLGQRKKILKAVEELQKEAERMEHHGRKVREKVALITGVESSKPKPKPSFPKAASNENDFCLDEAEKFLVARFEKEMKTGNYVWLRK